MRQWSYFVNLLTALANYVTCSFLNFFFIKETISVIGTNEAMHFMQSSPRVYVRTDSFSLLCSNGHQRQYKARHSGHWIIWSDIRLQMLHLNCSKSALTIDLLLSSLSFSATKRSRVKVYLPQPSLS